jgi:putative ABC transport system substrate-binding protein
MHGDLVAKRLALFKELLPNVAQFALLARAASPATTQYVKEAQQAAQTLGVQLQVLSLRDPSELDSLLLSIQRPTALVVADDAVFTAHRKQIVALALKAHLPSAYGFSEMVEAGGLMAYGPHYGDMYRRAAFQVDKLLKGVQAADLPVEQPTKFEFVINVKTAKALGLTIPPSLLLRVDQVIQ